MGKLRRNIKKIVFIFLTLFLVLACYFCYVLALYSDRWFSNSYNSRLRMNEREPEVIPGDILDRNGIVLATTVKKGNLYCRYYPKGECAFHVVGFHNSEFGRMGAEAFYIRYLMGLDSNVIEQIYERLFQNQRRGSDVVLTIDSRLQESVDRIMGKQKGAVVVLNPKTGEVLAMVSHPSCDPNTMQRENIDEDVLYNRATQGLYPPGSVFKIITLAAALENIEDVKDQVFRCDGFMVVDGQRVSCYKAHGSLGLKEAFTYSCNVTFAKLGLEIGGERLLSCARRFGFDKDFLFSDISLKASSIPVNRSVKKGELAWDAVGQGRILVTPFHMAMVAAAVANDGVMMEPKLLKCVKGRGGRIRKSMAPEVFARPLTGKNARIIKSMMENVVVEGTGKAAAIDGIKVAGKTGTAEVKSHVNSNTEPHAWFIGFAPADRPTLAIAVVIENGGSGGRVAAPLAGEILKTAIKMGY